MYLGDSSEFFSLRPETGEETRIYGFVKRLTKLPPEQAIERFYQFFFNAVNPAGVEARAALMQLAIAPESEKMFFYVLNRCFYTLCNPWRMDTAHHWAIRELILRLEHLPEKVPQNRQVRQLQRLVRQFVGTPQHLTLKRQMQVLFAEKGTPQAKGTPTSNPSSTPSDHPSESAAEPLGETLKRYFYLHEITMTTKDVARPERETILQLQRHTRQRFEQHSRRFVASCQQPQGKRVPNPSLLPAPEFVAAFNHYQPERPNSYYQQAQGFATERRSLKTMGDFQTGFSDYLLETLTKNNPRYRNNRLGRSLRDHLRQAADVEMPINQTMIVQVCRRALEFLVVENLKRPNTVNFQYLLKDVGHTVTIGVLLKVVMFCKAVRPWFEERFGILFHLYEQTQQGDIPWLVKSLEHLNIALALNHRYIAAY